MVWYRRGLGENRAKLVYSALKAMRYAILADIHANLEAFHAVLADAELHGGFDQIWCLGDVVGYGPDPAACIALLRRYPGLCVAGNHDWAAIGKVDTATFNPDAEQAALWTARQLSEEDAEFLAGLPLVLSQEDFTLTHGSPRDPIWEYIITEREATANFSYFDTPFCLVGHTHVPMVFALDRRGICYAERPEALVRLGNDRCIINCGGVGQPRDGDPRASYCILDVEQKFIAHYRVDYNFPATQRKMYDAGLPPRLAQRLGIGW